MVNKNPGLAWKCCSSGNIEGNCLLSTYVHMLANVIASSLVESLDKLPGKPSRPAIANPGLCATHYSSTRWLQRHSTNDKLAWYGLHVGGGGGGGGKALSAAVAQMNVKTWGSRGSGRTPLPPPPPPSVAPKKLNNRAGSDIGRVLRVLKYTPSYEKGVKESSAFKTAA